jgi:4-hydroxy-tetrahydrodipicolinate reductase
MSQIKISIIGAMGRMGKRIAYFGSMDENISLVGAVESKGNSSIGTNLIIENNPSLNNIKISDDINSVIKDTDVFIDFTSPESSILNLEKISAGKKAVVIGATGTSDEQKKKIEQFSKNIPIVFSPNMSIGVNVFFKVLEELTAYLKDYDTEIIELHHNKKKDSPSGTAEKIAEIISKVKNIEKENWIHGRSGIIGERKENELGIHAVRLGDVVGEHTVMFAGNSERIEFTHRAHSRDNFAKGAVVAAKWLYKKPAGLYNMFDVLSIK